MPDDLKNSPTAKPQLDSEFVRRCKEPGRYFDSRRTGLFLLIHKNGRKYWLQRIKMHGKVREAGLGVYPRVSLADARRKSAKNQVAARDGIDPVTRRKAVKPQSGGMLAFEVVARERYDKLVLTFKNPKKDGPRWLNALVTYAFPHLGKMPVDAIKPRHIEDMLMVDNLWLEKPELGRRILQRIGNIMRYAVMRGYRHDDPTASLKGMMLKQNKKKNPMRSVPYEQVPDALAKIRKKDGWPPVTLGMEFQILTAVRPGEARLARWSEIDIEAREWRIPAERMKMERELIVPLSDQALAVLKKAREFFDAARDDPLIFPSVSYQKGNPLSDAIFSKTMRELGLDGVPHGFRSSFRTWTQEKTNAPDKVAEAALGHANPNVVEGAYARSDYLEHRRQLMQMWADYVDGTGKGEDVRIEVRG